jgi:hypothetical protein
MRNSPTNNLGLSRAKKFNVGGFGLEVPLGAFNALNHNHFAGVNATVNFQLTD